MNLEKKITGIMKTMSGFSRRCFTSLSLAIPLTLGAPACQQDENKPVCYTDQDCIADEICEQSICTEPRKDEAPYAHLNKKTTNATGRATFYDYAGNEIAVKVTGERFDPLENITVHLFSRGDEHAVVAVDRQGNYFPDIDSFSLQSVSRHRLTYGAERVVQPLQKDISLNLDLVESDEVLEEGYKIVTEDMRLEGRFLGQDKNYNKYCMTLEQLSKSISVPLGVMFLAAKNTGMGSLVKVIKLATETPLIWLHDTYIKNKYGVHEGYEVWIPKTAMGVCGEEYDDAVCDISDGQLSRMWDQDLPFTQIRGSCERQPQPTEGEGEGHAPTPQCDDPNYLFCDDFTRGLSTEKWVLEAGVSYSVSDEGILLSRALATKPLRECPSGNFEVSFRVRFPGAFLSRDDFMLSLTAAYEELITSIHTQRFNSSSRMYLVCDFAAGGEAGIPEVRGPDPTEWATVRFQKNGEAFSLYVNDALKGSNRCTAQRPGISSLVFNAYDQTELDYVRVACK